MRARLLLLLLALAAAATATTIVLVQGECADDERIVCPLAFGVGESLCPAVEGDTTCPDTPSSCCTLLGASDFDALNDTLDELELVEEVNPWSAYGVAVDGSAQVHYDGENLAVRLTTSAPFTLVAPLDNPLCMFTVSLRFTADDASLRIMANGQEHVFESTAGTEFYDDYELPSAMCGASEVTMVAVGATVELQFVETCLVGAECPGSSGEDVDSEPEPPIVQSDDSTPAYSPVEPRPYCNRRGNSSTCWSIFGYANPNVFAVTLPIDDASTYNGFGSAPANRGQPSVFSPGTVQRAFAVQWPCKRYEDRRFFWALETPIIGHNGTALRRVAWTSEVLDNCSNDDFAALLV